MMMGSTEVKQEITYGLSIGTIIFKPWITFNHPRYRSQKFRIKYLEYRERYNVRHNGGQKETTNGLPNGTMTFDFG